VIRIMDHRVHCVENWHHEAILTFHKHRVSYDHKMHIAIKWFMIIHWFQVSNVFQFILIAVTFRTINFSSRKIINVSYSLFTPAFIYRFWRYAIFFFGNWICPPRVESCIHANLLKFAAFLLHVLDLYLDITLLLSYLSSICHLIWFFPFLDIFLAFSLAIFFGASLPSLNCWSASYCIRW